MLVGLGSLKSVTWPAGLKELTCEALPELADMDLRAAPDVKLTGDQ
jgi:hypothetical protein